MRHVHTREAREDDPLHRGGSQRDGARSQSQAAASSRQQGVRLRSSTCCNAHARINISRKPARHCSTQKLPQPTQLCTCKSGGLRWPGNAWCSLLVALMYMQDYTVHLLAAQCLHGCTCYLTPLCRRRNRAPFAAITSDTAFLLSLLHTSMLWLVQDPEDMRLVLVSSHTELEDAKPLAELKVQNDDVLGLCFRQAGAAGARCCGKGIRGLLQCSMHDRS